MILVDSDLWIYLLNRKTAEHRPVLLWSERIGIEDGLLIPTIVQSEVLHALRRFAGDDLEGTADLFLEQDAGPLPPTTREIRFVADTYGIDRMTGIGGRDAALLAYAHDHKATLATPFRKILRLAASQGLPTIDPLGP